MEVGKVGIGTLLERCSHFRGWYVNTPEDVSLLERCPNSRGWYVHDSMELEPEDITLTLSKLVHITLSNEDTSPIGTHLQVPTPLKRPYQKASISIYIHCTMTYTLYRMCIPLPTLNNIIPDHNLQLHTLTTVL